jgi:hypothetical protein
VAVFISVVTSPFEDVFNDAARETRTSQNVRRPLRGLEVKKDTYATLKVIDAVGRPIPLVDSSAAVDVNGIGQSTEYSNFILQSVQEQRVEKSQIVETFGEDYIFFFGERPRIYTFNAIILNSRNFNWKSEWWKNYNDTLRGTKLLERNARMYMYFDDVVLEGYMLQAQAVQTVEDPYKLPLTFQVFCTNYSTIGDVGSIFSPIYDEQIADRTPTASPTTVPPDDPAATADVQSSLGNQDSLTGFLADAQRFANDATFTIQRAIEQAKNTLYGRSLAFPNKGIGNQLYVPPIENQASFPSAPGATGERVPIWQQRDEYTAFITENAQPQYDQEELNRVQELLRLNSPEELDNQARGQLAKLGVNVGRPSANYLLLGRAAFAGIQLFGSFGIRQADGALNLAAGIPGLNL